MSDQVHVSFSPFGGPTNLSPLDLPLVPRSPPPDPPLHPPQHPPIRSMRSARCVRPTLQRRAACLQMQQASQVYVDKERGAQTSVCVSVLVWQREGVNSQSVSLYWFD